MLCSKGIVLRRGGSCKSKGPPPGLSGPLLPQQGHPELGAQPHVQAPFGDLQMFITPLNPALIARWSGRNGCVDGVRAVPAGCRCRG